MASFPHPPSLPLPATPFLFTAYNNLPNPSFLWCHTPHRLLFLWSLCLTSVHTCVMIKSLFPPRLLSKSADYISCGEESEYITEGRHFNPEKTSLCATTEGHSVTQSPEPSPALTQSYSDYWLFQVYCHPLSCCTHLLTGLQSSSFFNYCADFTYTFNTTYAK